MSSDYQPRESDHLVEPMFAGLGVSKDPPSTEDSEAEVAPEEPVSALESSPRSGRWRRWLRRLFQRG